MSTSPQRPPVSARPPFPQPTAERILDAALSSFASRGYEASSLDALAASIDVRKQTILYWYPSKEALLHAVVERCAEELGGALSVGLEGSGPAWSRIEAVVRAVFRLAGRRPELLALSREVGRLGEPHIGALVRAMEPLVARAASFLSTEMSAGRLRHHDPRALLLNAYSTVIGAATEVEVRASLGLAASARVWARRRRELLDELRVSLAP